MYEIEVRNVKTNETTILFGYSLMDAFRRAKLDMTDWEINYMEYVD